MLAGSDVVVLGVKIGSVRSVQPAGSQVRVRFDYKASQKVPADAHAVILEPTIVADRVLQLAPAYGGGPVLADGGTIPEERTGIPVELDEFNRNVSELAQALGPRGANRDGALTRLLQVGAPPVLVKLVAVGCEPASSSPGSVRWSPWRPLSWRAFHHSISRRGSGFIWKVLRRTSRRSAPFPAVDGCD